MAGVVMSSSLDPTAASPGRLATLSAPLPPGWTVREGRDAYLAENGFTLETYDSPTTRLSVRLFGFSLSVAVPNPPSRRNAVRLHDLHHVVTGYGTNPVGEAEVSAWEIRRGFGALGTYPRTLIVFAMLVGLLVAPRRTVRAWRASPGGFSLFHGRIAYDTLIAMRIGDLRTTLGVPEAGIATSPRRLHALAPPLPELGILPIDRG
jgi:hypothetical protein